MLRADVCMDILENLSRNDMDTLFVTNRQLGSLSCRLARRMSPRQVSIHHYHEGQFHLRFDAIERVVAFDDLPRYLEGSQVTDVELLAPMLDANAQRGM